MITLYKGMTPEDYIKFQSHHIPGFLADLYLGMIYSQPSLTGLETDTRYFISAQVDPAEVEDRSDRCPDMCCEWPAEWRSHKWAAPGSGHGNRLALFWGTPAVWSLVAVFHGDAEWIPYWENHKLQAEADLLKIWPWQ